MYTYYTSNVHILHIKCTHATHQMYTYYTSNVHILHIKWHIYTTHKLLKPIVATWLWRQYIIKHNIKHKEIEKKIATKKNSRICSLFCLTILFLLFSKSFFALFWRSMEVIYIREKNVVILIREKNARFLRISFRCV